MQCNAYNQCNATQCSVYIYKQCIKQCNATDI